MVDELFDRQYQAGRSELNAAVLDFAWRAGKAVGEAFAVLNRIEYSAPWAASSNRASFALMGRKKQDGMPNPFRGHSRRR